MARKKVSCFISYAWEGKRHANWVNHLAKALAANGVFVHVDLCETYPGMEIAKYMESSVRRSSHVLTGLQWILRLKEIGRRLTRIRQKVQNRGSDRMLSSTREDAQNQKINNRQLSLDSSLYPDASVII